MSSADFERENVGHHCTRGFQSLDCLLIVCLQLNINRLGYPHGECQDGDEFRKQYNVTYTRRVGHTRS